MDVRTAGNNKGLDPKMKALVDQTPVPNDFSQADGFNTAGSSFNQPVRSDRDRLAICADWKISQRHSYEAVYNHAEFLTDPDTTNNQQPPFPGLPQGTQESRRPVFSTASM